MTSPYFPHDELHLFCTRGEEGWRVYARPGALPPYLRPFFPGGEAFPLPELDLTDLGRFMAHRSVAYECIPTKSGSLQVSAGGEAAPHLAKWLANALASGVR